MFQHIAETPPCESRKITTHFKATAPVKRPTRYCLPPGFTGKELELKIDKGGISLFHVARERRGPTYAEQGYS